MLKYLQNKVFIGLACPMSIHLAVTEIGSCASYIHERAECRSNEISWGPYSFCNSILSFLDCSAISFYHDDQ